ncbi:MAG: class I lanthipeptide [Acidobacteria bacterium]|jgi:natural product precursor|nr:class I lanthipeptide [Acidobacteriota bacterium]
MKTKKIDKKLILNKNTISNLGNEEMNRLKGGETLRTECFTACATGCYACSEITFCSHCMTDEYTICVAC